jgi:hypothetical protein
MRPALDPTGHRVPRTKPTCLLHPWRPHRQRPFALVLHLHQHESSRNLHLQYLAKNQSTKRCQSLITQGSDHPLVLEPHMVLTVVDHMAYGYFEDHRPLRRAQGKQARPARCLACHAPQTRTAPTPCAAAAMLLAMPAIYPHAY